MPDILSVDLKDLIVRLLEKDPSKRIRITELRVSLINVGEKSLLMCKITRNIHGSPAAAKILYPTRR